MAIIRFSSTVPLQSSEHKNDTFKLQITLNRHRKAEDQWRSPSRPTALFVSTVFTFKGTQDWDFFWLRFWNLYYFFVSYVKILRFYQKKFLIGPFWGEVRFFRVVLGLRGKEIDFNLGQKIFFFSTLNMTPLYLLKIVFPKFDPLTALGWLSVSILGQNVKIYSS